MIIPVILCGGSGTRLWPFSRKAYPKQLLSLSSGYSMLQETVLRLQHLPDLASPTVICNEAHRFVVAEQLLEIGVKNPAIILEPYAKNTAPATAVAALEANEHDLLLVLPADHLINEPEQFCNAITASQEAVNAGYLVTFGVQPERPETGYGYIKTGQSINQSGCYKVAQFVEKPDLATAQKYVESKEYFWNSGMFMFRAGDYLRELEICTPGMVAVCRQSLEKSERDKDFIRLNEQTFATCKSDSIDYAVMERSKHVATTPLEQCGWSDLGSWESVYDAKDKDKNQNVLTGDIYTEDVTNCYLRSEGRL